MSYQSSARPRDEHPSDDGAAGSACTRPTLRVVDGGVGVANDVFDALGNPTRRQLVELLRDGERTVGALADALPISRPAVSKHLRVLERAGLVESEIVGRTTRCRLAAGGFDDARRWLERFWSDALARFALVAENTAAPPSALDGESVARSGDRTTNAEPLRAAEPPLDAGGDDA